MYVWMRYCARFLASQRSQSKSVSRNMLYCAKRKAKALPGSCPPATDSSPPWTRRRQMGAGLALVAGLLAWFPVAATADNHLSTDPQVENARALNAAGRYGEAIAVLRPLAAAADRPDIIDIRFLLGLSAIEAAAGTPEPDARAALLDEAIAALHAILVAKPELVRVRLELARAFFLKGEDSLARSHFEHVLAGEPLPAVAANVNRFLSAMRARRRWTAYGGMAIAPDSNIGAASESQTIYIFGLPFQRDTESLATSGLGLSIWGGGEYQHPLRPNLRLRAGADGSQREYEGRRFDQTFASVHVGPRWLISPRTEASMLANARRRWLGGDVLTTDVGARLEAIHLMTPRWRLRGQASWHSRNWQRNDAQDGPSLSGILTSNWVLSPTLRLNAAIGYSRERTEALRWRHANRWARVGVSVNLPLGFTVGAGGEYHQTRYKGDWTPFTPSGVSRRDRTRVLNVSVFNRAVTVFGLSPQLVLVNEARDSNAQLYDYRRNRAELRFQQQF